MSPNGKRLWKFLPTDVWLERDEVRDRFGHQFQLALSDLYNAELIELKFSYHDEDGIPYQHPKQFMRKKTIAEIMSIYNEITNTKSTKYNQRIFWEMLVRCKIKK